MIDLRFGNCLKLMPEIQSDSIPLIVTSSPYGVGKEYEKTGKRQDPIWKNIWLVNRAFAECARVVNPGGYICWNFGDNGFGKQAMGTEVLSTIPMAIWYWKIGQKHGMELQATRIWRKPFGAMAKPFFLNHHPRPVYDYEHIWTWRKPDGTGKERVGDHSISRRGVWSNSHVDESYDGGYEKTVLDAHCAAFPTILPTWCIKVYSKQGDTVLDPFMGSGTTGIACVNTDRDFIGMEIDRHNFELSKLRINNHQADKGQTDKILAANITVTPLFV